MSETLKNPELNRSSILDRLKEAVLQLRINRLFRVAQRVPVEGQDSVLGYSVTVFSSESDARLITHVTTKRTTPHVTIYTNVIIEKGDELSRGVSSVTGNKTVAWKECDLQRTYVFDSSAPQDAIVGFAIQDVQGELSDATRLLGSNRPQGLFPQLPQQ